MDSRGKEPIEAIAKLLWEASGSEGAYPWESLPARPKTVMVAVAYRVVNAVNVAHQILDHELTVEDLPDKATNPEAWN